MTVPGAVAVAAVLLAVTAAGVVSTAARTNANEDAIYVTYAYDVGGGLSKVNATSGQVVWGADHKTSINLLGLLGLQLVFGTHDSDVNAYDMATGRLVWQRSLGAPIDDGAVDNAHGGSVLVTAGTGIYRLAATNGQVLWQATNAVSAGNGQISVIVAGHAFIADGARSLILMPNGTLVPFMRSLQDLSVVAQKASDVTAARLFLVECVVNEAKQTLGASVISMLSDGTHVQHAVPALATQLPGSLSSTSSGSTITPDGVTLLVSVEADTNETSQLVLLAVHAGNLTLHWSLRGITFAAASRDYIFVCDQVHNTAMALSPLDGTIIWRSSVSMSGVSSVFVGPGGIALVNTEDGLVALEATTGKHRWTLPRPEGATVTLMVACPIPDPYYQGKEFFACGFAP